MVAVVGWLMELTGSKNVVVMKKKKK